MKLHYNKILLFALPLNILLTSYHVNTHKKPYVTTNHTTRYTSRLLSECDIQSLNYDKDAYIKAVKENFDRQTTQRFQEYEERMKEKRQKRKEECDKNIQKIIEEDKREKSLAKKVEKGCLRCGCGLGGGVLPVWSLVSGLWYASLSQYVSTTLVKEATDAGIKAGLKVGLEKVTEIAKLSLADQTGATIPIITELETLIAGKFTDEVTLYGIFQCINSNINSPLSGTHPPFFTTVKSMAGKGLSGFNKSYPTEASQVVNAVAKAKEGIMAKGINATNSLTTGITASIVAIIVIVLVMYNDIMIIKFL
ncbi:rifin PIR protein, putative [Plasmodium reichenowi]|uniref:Rifin PIR protein, putative n=1 Tax=Plasmodium reichenowi TaxID=5854 RepID=A0A2P9DT59_PLARE|nr:rifin PIR protein, putative [Plasmodium reichenowi]